MWFWECPEPECPFSSVSDTEEAVRADADRHFTEFPEHWRKI